MVKTVIMKCPFVIKICVRCKQLLVANNINFSKNKVRKDGLKTSCKECDKKYNKQWRKENKEQKKEYDKEWRKNNKEKIKEIKKQWYENNPEKVFNYHQKRRLKEENQGSGFTKDQWFEMMEFFDWRCAYSGKYIGRDSIHRTIDHIIPLDKGGLNEIWNLVPMYNDYNCSKHTNDMVTWYKQQEFFDVDRLMKIYEWQEYAFEKWGIING